MADPALRPLSIGEVLDTSFGMYRTLFVPLVTIGVVCRAIPTLVGVYLTASGGALLHPLIWLAQVLLSVVASAFGIAAVTFMVSSAYLGQSMTAANALRRAAALVGRLLVLSICTFVVIAAGLILLIIPGMIFAAGLSLSSVALVLEQPMGPTAAMDRSWKLTRGFRGKVMLALFVASLLLSIPVFIVAILGAIGSVAGVTSPVLTQVVIAIFGVVIYPFIYIVATVLYYDLRVRKEGFDLELLAAATQPA